MKKYDWFSDPGHGWIKIKRQELIDLGIEKEITEYSYQRGDFVYLEEDQDASTFIDALEKKEGTKFMNIDLRHHIANRLSRIRGYEPYNHNQRG